MSHGISSLLQALPRGLNVVRSFAEFEVFRVSALEKPKDLWKRNLI